MHRSSWKRGERVTARMFGAERQIGSGSLGRADRSTSDSTHERLYIECKHAKRHAVITLWDDASTKAKKEKKTPLVVLRVKGRPGSWFLIKDSDLERIADERRSGASGMGSVGDENGSLGGGSEVLEERDLGDVESTQALG